jgi:thiol-disulfide isomerase/thioredoxin
MIRRTILALSLVLGACSRDRPAKSSNAAFQPLMVGDTVPTYVAHMVSGDSVRIGPGGPVTLLNVWATWCTSCREEFASLEQLQRTFAPRGLRIVAVSVDQGNEDRVAKFAAAEGATFAIAHDPQGRIEQRFQVVGVPSTYLIGADGRLLWRYTGTLPDEKARAAVEQAVGAE